MNSVSKINRAGAACVAVLAIAQFGISSSAVAQSQPQPPVRATPAPAKPKPAPQAVAVPSAPAAATQGAARSTDDVVARVGNTEITTDELRSYVAALAPRDQAALARDPAQFSQAVRMLLANRLVLRPHSIAYPVDLIEVDSGEPPSELIAGRIALILNEP